MKFLLFILLTVPALGARIISTYDGFQMEAKLTESVPRSQDAVRSMPFSQEGAPISSTLNPSHVDSIIPPNATVPFTMSEAKCDDKTFRRLVSESEVIAVAKVVEVDPKPYLFGDVLFVQRVKYKVKSILKGNNNNSEIDVGHYVTTSDNPTVEPGQRHLSDTYFKKGRQLILFLTPDPGIIRGDDLGKKNAYLVFDVNCGAIRSNRHYIRSLSRTAQEK